MIPKHDFLH